MYLETIYILSKKSGCVRAIDVGEHLGYSKPSVSRAMGILKRDGYLTSDDTGCLKLTKLGYETAESVFTRHTILSKFLAGLGVDEITATDDACRIEHVISDKSFSAITDFVRSAEKKKGSIKR